MTSRIDSIPLFDLRDYARDPKAFAQAFGAGFRDYNLVRIKGHGIPDEVLHQADDASKRFFALPQDVKEGYRRPQSSNQVGYTSGDEQQTGASKADEKELFMVHRPVADIPPGPRQKYAAFLSDTPQVPEVPDFNTAMAALYSCFDRLTQEALKPLAQFMGLDENFFQGKTEYSDSPMRTIHYRPGGNAAPHLDASMITFVRGKSGLYVVPPKDDARDEETLPEENKKHAIAVETGDDEIILNGGRQLAILTNNYFKPGRHWVEAGADRHTIVYFANPNPDFQLDVLPSFRGQDNGLDGEYWMKTLKAKFGADPFPMETFRFVMHRVLQNYANLAGAVTAKPSL